MPEIDAASSRFGVTTSLTGRRSRRRARNPAAERRATPLDEKSTGSRTTFLGRWRRRPAATARTVRASHNIPIFTAAGVRSEKTASICRETNRGENGSIVTMPRVFCAVPATTTVAPYTACAAKVSRSAWIPAPPPESDPAIETTVIGRMRRALGIPRS
jgi:hypothetical protein